ncbi:hypothetical protein HCG51_27700 [Tolypothrix sp. PCC 7910]|uniref:hypothetical protein n=1 Tax=Tolypothrix sp. PCC 7910 TaxID=2099387 RepID=UPI0014279F82|nr:hypothetical protein [Tolypothrix sp. PCC 7910]QIR40126.1 hypothetical protein HCG51_27700 [Tolypothrix sp. PCC 7910]
MTSRADEIQRLIADIDNLLASNGKRLSKLLSSQAQEPKDVLDRVRDFLVKLGESETLASDTQNQPSQQKPRSPLLAKFVDQNNQQSLSQTQHSPEEQSQNLNSEIKALLQPLQAELATLLQERATLVQEIRQLEQRRLHNYSLTQQLANQEQIIKEFLEVLGSRLVPALTSNLVHSLANSSSAATTNNTTPDAVGTTPQPLLQSSEPVEQLTRLGKEFDQRLLSLDGTLNIVFEALQRNIRTYHESLSQALTRMHAQGLQGEQVMVNFVNNLTQYLQEFPQQPASLSTPRKEVIPPLPIEPGDTQVELVNQPLVNLPAQPENTTPPEDLDAMLLELIADASSSFETPDAATPTTLQSDSSPVDEVDKLYASLFGKKNETQPVEEIETNQVVTNELSPPETVLPSVLPTETVEPVDVVSTANNVELEQIDISVAEVSQETLPAIENLPPPPTDLFSQEWETLFFDETPATTPPAAAVTTTSEVKANQANTDTITALTDLLVDLGDEPQVLAVSSPLEDVSASKTVITPSQRQEVEVHDEQQENSLDNYIPASPRENLLSLETAATMPDISLDDEQLQLLDQDLANFDGLLNSQSPLITSWVNRTNQGHQQKTAKETVTEEPAENLSPNAFNNTEAPQLAPTSFPQPEAELDFSPIIEKKKEETTATADPLLSGAPSLNQPQPAPQNTPESNWYLGIDFGTTGISAALLNRSTCVVYPIYWSAENPAGGSSFQQSFRLPAEVYLPTASAPASVAPEKLSDNLAITPTPPKSDSKLKNTLYSAQLKPYLQVAIPYKSARQKWEPVLQFNDFSAGPLVWVVRSLAKLLLTLKSDRQSTTQGLTAAAVGLKEPTFRNIINNIAGVICTCPSSWSEQYRFNLREALLNSKLVKHPQQVFFVEEAIASLLSLLDAGNGEAVQLSQSQGLRPVQISDQPLIGDTLAINIGATATEMALVDLPENLSQFAHNDFMLHSFAYAGKGIEQDIICQLLLPPKSRQSRDEITGDSQISSQPGLWQSNIAGLDQMHWQSLGLEDLELPRVGEPDIIARIRLQQRLESSLLGQAVLDAALALKLILQHQESFTLDLADQRWILQRRDLESQVLVPFVRRLNRELNKLLVARGIPTEAINQAILTGGVTSIATVNRWLKQKLPNAKIIQDSYLGDNGAPNCSRVAYGLAMLPLHPQVLDIPRQQYTDYFLFTELLRLLPDRSLSFSEIIQLFEGRGINTRTCQQRLLAFLEGELPAGLIPNAPDSAWLSQSSQDNPDYHEIASAPLFEKQGNLSYRPNSQQLSSLRRYLDAIKTSTQQSLEEPYTVNFALEV